ncbi:putative membrane protein [Chitinivorax tropicus]|uniref:Putative membrane protein n=1 Tax=Chitinivorax tropicus TaxID=714531 RepID=A0A840MVI9_9PROT|nr:DUF979 domain-containing protein [Chitinivorax tropicus]MBB5020363.1 putative membrane protein [Chitinivorax tropicus]
MILKPDYLYLLAGVLLLIIAGMSLRDRSNPRRFATALFWALYSVVFLAGQLIPPAVVGVMVIVMALLAGLGGVRLGSYDKLADSVRAVKAKTLANKLFFPALIIPLVTVLCAVAFKDAKIGGTPLFDPKNVTLLSLGIGCLVAWPLCLKLTGDGPVQSMRESRRLLESMGWAVMLPQLLATLGLLFTDAGVGKAVADITKTYLAVDNRMVAVATYAICMALFTMIMGNAFAAFPVITAGIGLPILLNQHHGDAAVMAAIGMFSGYCGTLMTPMAANFNIVPAALLELPDKHGVIKVQWQTALPLLLVNIGLMYVLMFR